MSMKHVILLFAVLVCHLCSLAQVTFAKYYDAGGTYTNSLCELPSGNLFTGIAFANGISILDPEGQVIHQRDYLIFPFLELQSTRISSGNEVHFVGAFFLDSCTNCPGLAMYDPVIGRMDTLGNVSNVQYYEMNSEYDKNAAAELIIMNDKSIITWGREDSFFILKADSNLNHVWSRQFADQHHGDFQFIKELPGGDLLAGINMDTAGAVVARMDATGNFLWCKSYIRPKGRVHDALVESDSSFIITGFTEYSDQNMFIPYPPDFHPQLFMMKLDGEGEVQWCKGYDSAPDLWHTPKWSRIEKAQDGNYVVLATLGYPYNNFFHRPFLMKTTPNGDTLWTRSVGTEGKDYFTRSLLVCADGGLMFSGAVWGDLPGAMSMSYIFKADSLGHFPCNELYYPIEVSDLFPVDSSFTLTSVDGATAYPAYVQDTVYDAIEVYNACTITGVPHLYNQGKAKPRIRPNPNTGRFTVEFNDPLAADSFYSVYDAVGKLLFQRPLAKGQESEEIDLSRFGKGTYLVRITSRDGVCNERVVVQ